MGIDAVQELQVEERLGIIRGSFPENSGNHKVCLPHGGMASVAFPHSPWGKFAIRYVGAGLNATRVTAGKAERPICVARKRQNAQ